MCTPSSAPRPPGLLVSILGLVLGLGACSDPSGESGHALGAQLGPLSIRQAALLDSSVPRVVHHWELGDPRGQLPPNWGVLSGEYKITRAPGAADTTPGEPARGRQMLKFEDELVLRIRGPFDPRTFNQAVVSLEILTHRDTFDIGVRTFRGGKLSVQMVKTVQADKGSKTIVFELGHLLREVRACDQVTFFLHGAGRIGLRSVDLVHKPLALWLPARDAPRPVRIGDEARPAFSLTSQRPLETSFVAGPGLRLSFACGRPIYVSRLGERPSLAVTLSSQGQVLAAETYRLYGADRGSWRDFTMPVDTPPGAQVKARFELLPGEGSASGDPQFCALTIPELWEPIAEPRTVVLVTVDTHRGDHVGGARAGVGVETPFLDELAARGVFFADCYASANITIPSHATLLTGLTPRDTGVVTNTSGLSLAARTLAESFREAGYQTFAATSVGHLRDDPSGFAQGFDRFFAPERHDFPADVTIAQLADWLPDADGRPLFVWLHLFDVHAPYEPSDEYRDRYWPADRDPYDPELPELLAEQRTGWDPDLRDVEFNLARYKAEVTQLDARLRTAFDLPRLEHAIVAVTADHGEAFGQHGYWFNHSSLYPATASVPLVLAWPEAAEVDGTGESAEFGRGVRIEAPVRQLDVGRTLLNLAGLERTEFPGRDLLGPRAASPQRFGLATGAQTATLSEDRWFAALFLRKLAPPGSSFQFDLHQLELFDLETDPDCLSDVVADHPQVARRMRALIVHWLQSRAEGTLAESSSDQDTARLAELAALGYATDAAPADSELFDAECECEYCRAAAR